MSRKRSKRVIRMPKLPVMKPLRDEFGMQMHTALAVLKIDPRRDSYDALARIFNVVQVAIHDDAARAQEKVLINSGVMAMNQIQAKIDAGLKLRDHEIGPIQNAVNTIDQMLGRLDVGRLYQAMITLNTMAQQ